MVENGIVYMVIVEEILNSQIGQTRLILEPVFFLRIYALPRKRLR